MDIIDVKIINYLMENSRMNSSDISEKIKLSVSAVIERIKKLENSGIIKQYSLILNNNALGKDIAALISVSLDNPRFNQSFEEMIRQNSHIVEAHYIAGDYDYSLKIVTSNTKSLEKVLNDIKSINGVSKTRTMIIFSTIKEAHSSPIRLQKKGETKLI